MTEPNKIAIVIKVLNDAQRNTTAYGVGAQKIAKQIMGRIHDPDLLGRIAVIAYHINIDGNQMFDALFWECAGRISGLDWSTAHKTLTFIETYIGDDRFVKEQFEDILDTIKANQKYSKPKNPRRSKQG